MKGAVGKPEPTTYSPDGIFFFKSKKPIRELEAFKNGFSRFRMRPPRSYPTCSDRKPVKPFWMHVQAWAEKPAHCPVDAKQGIYYGHG
jgi:hypothetical protein